MSSNFPNRATFHFWMNMDKNIRGYIEFLIVCNEPNEYIVDKIKQEFDMIAESVSDSLGKVSGAYFVSDEHIQDNMTGLAYAVFSGVITDLTFYGAIDYEYIIDRIRREMDDTNEPTGD